VSEESAAVGELCEQLAVVVAALAQRDAVIAQLRAENAELRRQLGLNSRNSSKPPSTDGLAKPAPKSLRRRKPGGQPGYPGSRLEQVGGPDEVLRHEPRPCGGCGSGLEGAVLVGVRRRQVFDIPPIAVRVIEQQLVERRCGCGTVTAGQAPEGVGAPVQYGPRIGAIMVYLYVGQFLSKASTATALAELFGTPVSSGTVASMSARAAGRARRVHRAGPRQDRRIRGRALRRDRAAGRGQAALGALGLHRQVLADHRA